MTMYLLEVLLLSGITLSLQHPFKVGEPCECKESSRCSYWIEAVKRGKYLDLPVCGYDPNTLAPLLCCSGSHAERTGKSNRSKREVMNLDNIQMTCTITTDPAKHFAQIADQKCDEYGKLINQSVYEVSIGDSSIEQSDSNGPQTVDTCEKTDENNEDSSGPGEFPHMALIGYGEKEIKWLCGGSLISERFILTVASCITRWFVHKTNAQWVKLGELDLSSDTDVNRPQVFKISETFVHPHFRHPHNDIALLKLDRDVPFTIYVRPACIFTRSNPPDYKVNAAGWSRKSGSKNDTLKKIKMELILAEECNAHIKSSKLVYLPKGINCDLLFCAVVSDPKKLETCSDDKGGPLQIALNKPNCMYGIIGLTSFGMNCRNGTPVGYTRVAHFVPWIVDIVWPDDIDL